MAAPNDVRSYDTDEVGDYVFQARDGSRLAAIVQSFFYLLPPEEERERGYPLSVSRWGHWRTLAACDPLTARYVIEQLSAATEHNSAARLAVVAMDYIYFCPPAPDAPEGPHAP
ncbi:hypothetical protein [Microcystis phage vB_MaeS-yong1]|nr:hypothetical protein [Microcystis phage vB_MaeS-yong1]